MPTHVLIESFSAAAGGSFPPTELGLTIRSLDDFRAVDVHVVAVDAAKIIRLLACLHSFIHLLTRTPCFVASVRSSRRWQNHLTIYKIID